MLQALHVVEEVSPVRFFPKRVVTVFVAMELGAFANLATDHIILMNLKLELQCMDVSSHRRTTEIAQSTYKTFSYTTKMAVLDSEMNETCTV